MSALDTLGAANLRDLGGHPTQDGHQVRFGLLFRSEFPVYLDAEGDGATLLGLRTVVDLRRDDELAHESHPWPEWGVRHVQVPLSAGGESSWRAGYHSYLEAGAEHVVAAIRVLVGADAAPALFFCAAGKDRTGVVAAITLAVLGVAREVILEDHLRSAAGIDRIVARLAPTTPYRSQLAGVTSDDVRPDAAHVELLLDWLDARGGVEQWLVDNGVPAPELDAFRDRMLVAVT